MFFCLLCHGPSARTQDICHRCQSLLPWNQQHCERCAEPTPDSLTALCRHCAHDEPHFDQCHAPFVYDFPIDQLILQGKAGKRSELLFVLARLLVQSIQQNNIALPNLLLPVPMHPAKQQTRGYNQAGVIASLVGRRLGVPVRHNLISKIREPKQQKTLSRSGRQDNLKRAFRIERQQLNELKHASSHIVLIDDVITTGSTLNQLARQLRSSGVERVDGWAIARTPTRHKQRTPPTPQL
jgi:ComF family protein